MNSLSSSLSTKAYMCCFSINFTTCFRSTYFMQIGKAYWDQPTREHGIYKFMLLFLILAGMAFSFIDFGGAALCQVTHICGTELLFRILIQQPPWNLKPFTRAYDLWKITFYSFRNKKFQKKKKVKLAFLIYNLVFVYNPYYSRFQPCEELYN